VSRYPANGPSMSGVKPFRVYFSPSHKRPKKERGRVWSWVRSGENLKKWKEKLRRKKEKIKAERELERVAKIEERKFAREQRKRDAIAKAKRIAANRKLVGMFMHSPKRRREMRLKKLLKEISAQKKLKATQVLKMKR